MLPDGKIVVLVNPLPITGISDEIRLARFNADGTLDRGFGRNGTVSQPMPLHEIVNLNLHTSTSLVAQADGKILMGAVPEARVGRTVGAEAHQHYAELDRRRENDTTCARSATSG
jgi:hypothetical protein